MSTTPTKEPTEGDILKIQALAKLKKARALIDSARSDMCNLEGTDYCTHYENAWKLYHDLGTFIETYSKLAPPTGVFKI